MVPALTESQLRPDHPLLPRNGASGKAGAVYFHDPASVSRLDIYVPDSFSERSRRIEALIASESPYDFYADLSRIRVPTLIVRGDSEALPMVGTLCIAERIPDSRLVALKDCGHFSFAECPDERLAAICGALRQE